MAYGCTFNGFFSGTCVVAETSFLVVKLETNFSM